MLKFFTRLEKTRNFVLLVFAILMVGSLVFFYTPARNDYTVNLSQSQETVASVGGHKVTVGELIRQKENYSQFSRGQSFPAKMILESLIGSRITRVEADRLGLSASDAEVAAAIREQFKTDDGKPFDQAKYEQNVTEQFGNIASYEQSVRDDISAKKLEAFLTAGVTVSEAEVLSDFQRKNTKFDLNYVAVNSTDLAKTITPTDAELREYFDKNKASYYVSVPQKKIKYVFVNTSKIGDKLQVSDADLKTEFDALPADKKVAGVNGQEIVLRVPKPDMDAQVQAKANEIAAELKKDGPLVAENVFADKARGRSENTASAPSGGNLPGAVKENPNKPDDPYQRLLKMKPGEITEPISYQGRYFILRAARMCPRPTMSPKRRSRFPYAIAGHMPSPPSWPKRSSTR